MKLLVKRITRFSSDRAVPAYFYEGYKNTSKQYIFISVSGRDIKHYVKDVIDDILDKRMLK